MILLVIIFPCSPLRDPIQFPDLVHALKPDPITNVRGGPIAASRLWDFMSLRPESMHFLTYLFADNGTVKVIEGFRALGLIRINGLICPENRSM